MTDNDQKPSQTIEWLLEQLADPAVRAYAARLLEEDPALLSQWFNLLVASRLVTVPPPPSTLAGSVEPDWQGGRILEAAAMHKVSGVVEALEAVPPCGPAATHRLLQAFAFIDDPLDIARLVPQVVRWLRSAPGLVFDVPALTNKLLILLDHGNQAEATQLLDELLAFTDSSNELKARRTAAAKITDFWLRRLFEKILAEGSPSDLPWLARRLELKLRELQEWEVADIAELAPPAYLHSFYLVPIDELGGDIAHFDEIVAWALRETVLRIATTNASEAASFLDRWLPERVLLLRRIALYVLAQYAGAFPEQRGAAVRLENLTLDDCYPEFWRFLSTQFEHLDERSREEVEEWILSSTSSQGETHRRYRWLRAIAPHLTAPVREIFNGLYAMYGDEQNLDRLVIMGEVGLIEPESPVPDPSLSQWSVGEIVRYCLHYVGPEEAFQGPSKEGLADAVQSEIKRRTGEFAAAAAEFKQLAGADRDAPRYVEAFFRGLDSAVQEMKTPVEPPDPRLGDLIGTVLSPPVTDLIDWLDGRDGSPRERFVPIWEDARRAAADLLLDGLEAAIRLDPPLLKTFLELNESSLLNALIVLQNAQQPSLGDEDSQDPMNKAINSTRGRGLFAAIAFLRCWAQSKKVDAAAPTFEVHAGAMALLTRRLTEEESPAVRCVFGWRLPFFYAINRAWVEQHLGVILPQGGGETELRIWRATWDAYVGFNQLHDNLWSPLRSEYSRAVEHLGERWYETHPSREVDQHLASHVFLAWFLSFDESEALLKSLLEHSDDDLRAQLASFAALVLREQVVAKGFDHQSTQWEKLKDYWASRLQRAGEFGQPDCGPKERVAFIRWLEFVPEALPAIRPFLEQMIEGLAPAQDWEAAEFVEYLSSRGEQYPVQALESLRSLAQVCWPRWLTHEQETVLKEFLRAGISNQDAAPLVEQFIGILGQRYQLFSYREILSGTRGEGPGATEI